MKDKSPNPPRKRGRRSREEELQKIVAELGVDPDTLDPRRILASIAADATAPATARVSAAKALLILSGAGQPPVDRTPPAPPVGTDIEGAEVVDLATRRAVEIMNRRNGR